MLAAANISHAFVLPTVAGAVDLVVHLAKDVHGARRVREVVALSGRVEDSAGGGVIELAQLFATDPSGRLIRAEGFPPHADRYQRAGYDVAALLDSSGGLPDGHRTGAAARGWTLPVFDRRKRAGEVDARYAVTRFYTAVRRGCGSLVANGVATGAGQRRGGSLAAIAVVTISSTWSIALVFGVFGAAGPWLFLRRRVQQRARARREVWPYVVDDLSSGIRAGLSLPEAVAAIAERGPTILRPAFARFAAHYRSSGSFNAGLDRLATELADPFADRVIEALRLARDVGGTDVGRLLRTLSQALREDARARGEIEARQSWTVNGARLAVVAPWLVLLLLASRSSSVQVYDEPAGLLVLGIGAVLSVASYLLMQRIGRLPSEARGGAAGASS